MAVQITKLAGLKSRAKREGWLRWVRSEADERALLDGYRFEVRRAVRVEEFLFTFCQHSKGSDIAGKPFVLADWQREQLVFPLFGWLNEQGYRRFRKASIWCPRKNGKSTLASGIGLYMLCGDGEGGADVFAAATDRAQSRIIHEEAQNMVKSSPSLASVLEITDSKHRIRHAKTKSKFVALSARGDSLDGLNPHCVLGDEIHEWQGFKLYNVLNRSMGARKQPLFFMISTAGESLDREAPGPNQYKYAKAVEEGVFYDPTFFPLIYTVKDPECSILDEKEWKRANPALGQGITTEGFRAEAREASRSTTEEASFRRYKLNIWTTAGTAWMDPPVWKACRRDYTAEELQGRVCYAAIDMSRTRDTSSLQLVFPMEDGAIRLLSYFWLPEDAADKLNDRVTYRNWEQAGAIFLHPGKNQDFVRIKEDMVEILGQFQTQELAFDPYGAGAMMAKEVCGFIGCPDVGFKQWGKLYRPAVDEIEARSVDEMVHHNGNPVMTWQMENVKMRVWANGDKMAARPVNKDDIFKIDGPAAMLMAVARYLELASVTGEVGCRLLTGQ